MKRFRLLALGSLLTVLAASWSVSSAGPATAPATRPVAASRPAMEPGDRPLVRMGKGGQPDQGWLGRHAKLVERAKQGNIEVYFLGDSITDGWAGRGREVWKANYEPLKAANFGISADRTSHVLYRITTGEFDGIQPKVVVLMIGTNNFSAGATPGQVAEGVLAIVRTIQQKSPATKVLLLAIFPRGKDPANPVRGKIKAANELLARAADGKQIVYLDLTDKFLTPDGTLPADIMPDALHPNAKGYQIWADAMNPVLRLMLGLPATQPAH